LSGHLSTQIIERYRRRTLSPVELLRADDHLSACEVCRTQACEAAKPERVLLALHANLRAEAANANQDHLAYEQIAALVDGGLDAADREVAESHLELCHLCKDEVEDLRAAVVGANVKQPVRSIRKPTFAEKLTAFGNVFVSFSPARLAVAAVALLFMSLTATVLWRQAHTTPEVAQAPRTSAADERPRPSIEPALTDNANPSDDASDANSETVAPTPVESGAASAQIAVTLDDAGGRVTLDNAGKIAGLPSLSPSARQAVKNALTNGRIETPSALSGRAGTLMGESDEGAAFSLLNPVGVIVRADRPRLSWRPLPGASRYTVTILDSNLKTVATSPPLSTTAWTLPRALNRGRIYTWQVAALKAGEEIIAPQAPAPEARFKILEKVKDDELRGLERSDARSHLARGVLYARAGLLDEAERELRALAADNPKSPVARKLLRSVNKLRSSRGK